MNRISLLLCLTLIIPMIQSCITAPKRIPMRDDPLIGKLVDTSTGRFVTFKTLMNEITSHDIIYLSEKHDNPMHHAIQHRIIQELIDRGKLPALGFEFFAMEDTPHLLNFLDSARIAHTATQETVIEKNLRRKLGWEKQSDTMWAYYFDLLKLGRNNGLTLAGLDLSSAQKRRITRKGAAGLSPLEKKRIFSTSLTNPVYQNHMEELFKAVHCGMGHGKMLGKIYDTWLARNDTMALSITRLHDPATAEPVVVIMGNGHTEYGLGVIDRVTTINGELSQINLAMIEITREPSELTTYLSLLDIDGFKAVPQADFLWFTQRVSYKDPCLEFKRVFQKMKSRKKKD
jgi:uncharacterized iron-regulated protein